MDDRFFKKPILNSPYEYPRRHWELDESGQPTQRIMEYRRSAQFITPIPKPKKHRRSAQQIEMVLDEGRGLSTRDQQYDLTSAINTIRDHVNRWRMAPNPNDWRVTPETARLLQHWRHHRFSSFRPFFCQVGAVALREVQGRRQIRCSTVPQFDFGIPAAASTHHRYGDQYTVTACRLGTGASRLRCDLLSDVIDDHVSVQAEILKIAYHINVFS